MKGISGSEARYFPGNLHLNKDSDICLQWVPEVQYGYKLWTSFHIEIVSIIMSGIVVLYGIFVS